MDSNKDEAERCMELAELYLREKKYEEAEKFVRKALKLYPMKKAEGKLTKIYFNQYRISINRFLFFILSIHKIVITLKEIYIVFLSFNKIML